MAKRKGNINPVSSLTPRQRTIGEYYTTSKYNVIERRENSMRKDGKESNVMGDFVNESPTFVWILLAMFAINIIGCIIAMFNMPEGNLQSHVLHIISCLFITFTTICISPYIVLGISFLIDNFSFKFTMNKYFIIVLKKGDTIATVKVSAKLVGVLTALNVRPTGIKSYPLSSEQLLVAMDCISNFRPEVRPTEKEIGKLKAAFKQGYTLCKIM